MFLLLVDDGILDFMCIFLCVEHMFVVFLFYLMRCLDTRVHIAKFNQVKEKVLGFSLKVYEMRFT